MAKHTYRIGATVELQSNFQPQNAEEKMIYEEDAQGEITDLSEFDDETYFVVFDGYTNEDGADLGFWVKAEDLYVF